MSEAPSLGDFFKAKAKKKIKASNLNNATTVKPEEKKTKAKSTEDDAWEEEQVVASTMKVEVAGKLTREEEKKDDEDIAAPAWGQPKGNKDGSSGNANLNEKKFPTLAKSVGSSAINVDDGSDTKVNIQTSKNHFAALEGDDDEEDEGAKRPKEIKPAMVTKKKGEREKVALQREIEKVTGKETKKKASKEEDDDEDEEEAEAEDEGRKKKKEEKKDDKKASKPAQSSSPQKEKEEEELAEDLKIPFDMVASKEKYKGRKKLPPQPLPKEELEEEKENRPKPAVGGGGKKKKQFANFDEDDGKKKLLTMPDDW